MISKVSKGAKIRNLYNQVSHLTQDTYGKVINLQLDTTNESQEVSPFPAGDHKAHISRRAQRHSKHKTEQKHKRSTNEVPPWNGQYNILLEGLNQFNGANLTLNSGVDQVISNPFITFYNLFELITKIRFSTNSFEFIN